MFKWKTINVFYDEYELRNLEWVINLVRILTFFFKITSEDQSWSNHRTCMKEGCKCLQHEDIGIGLFVPKFRQQLSTDDLDSWYLNLKDNSPEQLFQFLVEDTKKSKNFCH